MARTRDDFLALNLFQQLLAFSEQQAKLDAAMEEITRLNAELAKVQQAGGPMQQVDSRHRWPEPDRQDQ